MVTPPLLSSLRDEDLLALLASRQDHAAFAELVKRHAGRFRLLSYRFTHSLEEAEDIVQDAFTRLWLKPQQWDPHKKVQFTTWFYRIIVNRSLDFTRRKKTAAMPEEFDAPDIGIVAADEAMIADERQAAVEKAFRALPQNMQTALNLSFYDPVPNKDAAQMMGMSLKAFQSLVMRAKTTLKTMVLEAMPQHEDERNQRYGG